jgi:hypothetical protein
MVAAIVGIDDFSKTIGASGGIGGDRRIYAIVPTGGDAEFAALKQFIQTLHLQTIEPCQRRQLQRYLQNERLKVFFVAESMNHYAQAVVPHFPGQPVLSRKTPDRRPETYALYNAPNPNRFAGH